MKIYQVTGRTALFLISVFLWSGACIACEESKPLPFLFQDAVELSNGVYEPETIDNLHSTKEYLGGRRLRVEGWLNYNPQYIDQKSVVALFGKERVSDLSEMLMIDSDYAGPLSRWIGKYVRIFGVYWVHPNDFEHGIAGKFIRIDRVEVLPKEPGSRESKR